MRTGSMIARIAAVAALAVAVVVVAVILLSSGSTYTVNALFQNASQIVKGDLVQVSGLSAGKVTGIDVTPDGQARLTLEINSDFAPLRRGTQANVRQASLSGIANRYVDLELAPSTSPSIPSGGTIGQDHTTSAVDLDEIFNIFSPTARDALASVLRGSAQQFAGRRNQAQQNLAFRYLSPSLASSSVLFRELNRDTPLFRRFIGATANLVTDVASRKEALSGLVAHLATTTTALGSRRAELADAINQLPRFMRRANTTFVNLRTTLDSLQPLVDESKPVARRLRPFLADLRVLAANARPTIRDLALIERRPGANNDLIDLTRTNVPVRDVALRPVRVNGRVREGAFPASIRALRTATPELAFARPYAPDLTGWFDDFSHTGFYDALGGISRAAVTISALSLQLPGLGGGGPADLKTLEGRFNERVRRQSNRCPGSVERGRLDATGSPRPAGTDGSRPDSSTPFQPTSPYYSGGKLYCDPTQVPPGD